MLRLSFCQYNGIIRYHIAMRLASTTQQRRCCSALAPLRIFLHLCRSFRWRLNPDQAVSGLGLSPVLLADKCQ